MYFIILKSAISRQIVFWVSLSIILIEAIILIPSAIRREQELINNLEENAELDLALIAQEATMNNQVAARVTLLNKLFNRPRVLGGSLMSSDGELLKASGKSCTLSYSQQPQKGITILFNSNSSQQISDRVKFLGSQKSNSQYQLTWLLSLPTDQQVLSICYDTESVRQEIYAYIQRISILVLVIAGWVALGTMLILQQILVRPIMRLRDDLLKVGQAVVEEEEIPKFSSTQKKYRNELDDMVGSFLSTIDSIFSILSSSAKLSFFPKELSRMMDDTAAHHCIKK